MNVTSIPTRMSSCYDPTGKAVTALNMSGTALVTSDPSLFRKVQPKLQVTAAERGEIQALADAMIRKASASLALPAITRVEKFRLNATSGEFIVAEDDLYQSNIAFFGIWHLTAKGYDLVASNAATGFQEPESFIGTVRFKDMKSDYIVTVSQDEEGYSFNVYAVERSVFRSIYRGGGGGC